MARANRRARQRLAEARRRARQAREMPDPMIRERAPGVYDIALPIPPGATPDQVRAAVADLRRALRDELGADVELSEPRFCTCDLCEHEPPNDAGHH